MEKPVTGICHSPSDHTLVVEPKYCPQSPHAVVDWCMLGEDEGYKSNFKKEDMKEKARKHLAESNTNCSLSKTETVDSGSVCERIACYRKPIKCIDLGDNVGRHPKRKRGKVLAELKKLREQSSGNQSNNLLGSGKNVRDAVISSPSNHKARSILSYLIDNNVLLPRTRVHYRGRNGCAPSKRGRITRDGINCDCCYTLFSLTAFEAHAGSSNHRPAANILLEDGRSLQDCRKQEINSNLTTKRQENDEICSVCHYVGELVLCCQCPSSFHKSCIGLQDFPDGDWFCPSCACGVCGRGKFQEDKIFNEDFVTCKQCERRFHIGCLRSKEMVNKDHWFCARKCECIFLGLGKLLGKPIPVGVDNLTWTLLKSTDSESCNLEDHSKLNVALSLMHEIFEPVKQALTNRDLVEDVIFSRGSELKQSNFRGFYTVLLERNDEVICVATVRIYGEKVAEIPLVGTRFQHRRCGMCCILMDELEKQLMALGVERLILHAAPTVLKTWTTSFGFSKMTDFEKVQFLDYTFLDFQDTIMCQKLLLKKPAAEIVDQGLVDSAVKHGKFNFECLDEEGNFQEASRDSNSDYSKRRNISACENQSSDYSKLYKRRKISAYESRLPFHDTTRRYLMSAF